MSKALYAFRWDVGRMGDVQGLFIADKEVVDKAIGSEVYFGEILGKHSEVYGELEKRDLTIKTENPELIAWLEIVFDSTNISGYNPLEYIDE